MSILDSSNTPQNIDPKDIAKNISDASGLTDKVNQKLNEATAPISEAVDKAQQVTDSVKNTLSQSQDKLNQAGNMMENIKDIDPDGVYGFNNFTLTPPEELEKQAALSSIISYGGDIANMLGDSHIVYSTVQIDGQEVLKESHFTLSIKQEIAEHDTFEIICPCEAFDERNAYPLSNTRNFLGKRTTIQLKQFGKTAYIFTGIITHITNKKIDGYSHIILAGKSPTILLENGLDCQSFEKKTLEDIVKTATAEYPSDLIQWDMRPNLKDPLLYTVQYRESDFDFIKRLGTRYGEWFYYDGQQIVFGGFGGKTLELIEEQDVYEFELKMQLVPQKFTYISYDARQATEHSIDSDSVPITHRLVNPFQQYAIQASEETFTKVPQSLYNQSLLENGKAELKAAVKRQRLKRQDVFYLEARSNNPNIRLGDIVKLKAWMPGYSTFKTGEVPLEAYRVIKINHHHEGVDGYYNTFTGVPADNTVPPYMNEDAIPQCEEQSAIVTDNNDPQGMSRIRVQFPWQKVTNGQSPWIRVTTPYAGKGKGMHVLPEIGEEVVVGFENGNAEKPVILGAMFNGQGKSGHGGAGNYTKGLQTASGNKLLMNDQLGSVLLEDHGQTSMKFDGKGNSSIGTSSKQTIVIGGTKEAPDGQANLKMDKDGNIMLEGKTNITLKVGENTIVIDQNGLTFTNKDANSIAITPEGISDIAKIGKIESTAEAGIISIKSTISEISLFASTKVDVTAGASVDLSAPEVNSN